MRQLAMFPATDAAEVLVGQEAGGSVIHMVSIDPEANRFRFYTIAWGQTLWGEWAIQATWGRIGGLGRRQVGYFTTVESLRETLLKMVARRLARGYRLTA